MAAAAEASSSSASTSAPAPECPYAVGRRYLHAKTHQRLTLRYIGALPAKPGLWLGVEYDTPSAGRHNGAYGGEQLFQARARTGGFIRYSPDRPPLRSGSTFLEALEERYGHLAEDVRLETEAEQQSRRQMERAKGSAQEHVLLGGSGIVVEAPRMAGVRRRVARLENLREIGFDGDAISSLGATAGQVELMRRRLGGVRVLNLSASLLGTWSDVAAIADLTAGLETLVMHESRLGAVRYMSESERQSARTAFGNVKELLLGHCALDWREAIDIATLFPSLRMLYLNDNELSTIDGEMDSLHGVRELCLDGCGVTWDDVARLQVLPSLESLLVSETPIKAVSPCSTPFPRLTRLWMANTHLTDWRDIDRLASWAQITNLKLSTRSSSDSPSGSDTLNDPTRMTGNTNKDRAFLIAKLPHLEILNQSAISVAERWDAEVFYVHRVRLLPTPEDWSRYDELVAKHNLNEVKGVPANVGKLRDKMINLNLIPPSGQTFTLRLLPSLPAATLHKRVAMRLKHPGARVWTARPHPEAPEAMGAYEPIEELGDGDVGRWVGDGDYAVVVYP